MNRLSRLALTGFMGAGKSTVAPLLAGILGWQFIDVDGFLEAANGRTVAEIFQQRGERHFRDQEGRAIRKWNGEDHLVLALGGGALEDAATRSLLLTTPETCLVFLEAPLSVLLERCAEAGRARPLLTTPEELEARHNRRLPHYRAAHLTVLTTDLTPPEVADRVLKRVRERWLLNELRPMSPRDAGNRTPAKL